MFSLPCPSVLCYLHSSVLQAVGFPGGSDPGPLPSRSSCRCVGLRGSEEGRVEAQAPCRKAEAWCSGGKRSPCRAEGERAEQRGLCPDFLQKRGHTPVPPMLLGQFLKCALGCDRRAPSHVFDVGAHIFLKRRPSSTVFLSFLKIFLNLFIYS